MAVTDVLFSGLVSATSTGDSRTAGVGSTPLTDTAGRSGALDFSGYRTLSVFVQLKTLAGGTSPSCQVILDSGDGQASTYWAHLNGSAPTWTSAVNQYRTSMGPGTSNNDTLASLGRFIWNINGSPSGCTFYVHIEGQR